MCLGIPGQIVEYVEKADLLSGFIGKISSWHG